jgi:spermidine synthase
MPSHDAVQRRFLLFVFIASGFSGLIYESVWAQYLKLFLGHAAYAQTVVLAMYMGGMALGSWLVARYSARIRSLLWGYLLVEGLIGLFGVVFHRVFVAATDFSFGRVIPALPAGFAIDAYKWSLAALLVLPQSVLLGMTFPLISGGIIRRWPEQPGATLSALYFTNSLGAAVGVLVSGFVLIGAFGLPGTTLTAGLINVTLAVAVWLVARRETEPAPPSALATGARSVLTDAAARWFVLAALLTGVASFMYELGWIRMLSLVLGSSTHSFELMLSAFIFGLAFGGLFVRKRIDRISDPEGYLGWIMLVMGVLAALTVPAGNLMFDFMAWALGTFARTANGYVAFNVISQSIAILIMVPTTFCAGMTLPVLTHALMRRGIGERAIGAIYSLNTLGAILGVLLAVHILMPWIGLKGVILTGSCIHVALGLSRVARGRIRSPVTAAAMGLSVAILGLIVVLGRLDPLRIASTVYRTGRPRLPSYVNVLYLRDGKTATVTLIKVSTIVSIETNGKPDAAVNMGAGRPGPDESTMVLAAAIPLSLHPNAARVANIGFGSGITSHMLLASSRLKRLDSIEIEPAMVEAARLGFAPRIHNVFEDPRSHIVFADAKTFFAAQRQPYDLIVSEPSNPWVSGVATLFSDEFYGRIVHYLKPDGYFAQWVQTYETNLDILASIAKALSHNFGSYAIYNLDDGNVLIVASRSATLPALSSQIFQWPLMRAELDRIGVQSLTDIERREIGDGRILDPLFASVSVPMNSDYFPYVDLNAPRTRFMRTNANELMGLETLPLPVLELIGGDAPVNPTPEPSDHSQLARDGLVRRALAIRRALSGGSMNGLDARTTLLVLLMRPSAANCVDPQVRRTWNAAVAQISAMTAAYMSPLELADVWSSIKSTPCYRDATAEQRAWPDLFAAVAARNAAQIVALGTQLLNSDSHLPRDDVTYLATAIAAAYLHMGQAREARNLLATRWGSFAHTGDLSLALRELLALSYEGGSQALAEAHEKRSDESSDQTALARTN